MLYYYEGIVKILGLLVFELSKQRFFTRNNIPYNFKTVGITVSASYL